MTPSLPQLLSAAAARHPRAVAVMGAEAWTFAALDRRVRALAARLREAGVEGGRVGLLLPNGAAFPVAFHGILRTGASAVLLNPLCVAREIAEQLSDAGARTVVTLEAMVPLLPPGAAAVLADGEADAPEPADGGPDAHDAAAGEDWGQREAAVIYTSALDGWARGARLTHGSLGANLRATVQAMRLGPGDRVAALLPLSHAFGLTVTLNAPLAAGAAVIPVERFHPVRVLEMLEESGATLVCGVPAMFAALAAAAARRGPPAHALRLAICGGAPLPDAVAREWEAAFGIPLRQGYGLTEASPVCLFNDESHPHRPGTLGVAFPGVTVTVRDGAGAVLPPGEAGELCVAGENVFAGYVGGPAREAALFHGDALRTGDRAVMDADGYVRFLGWIKPMFTRGGFNVYPAEIRRVLEADPRIASVEVRPVPDPVKEFEITLTVRPAPGAALDEDEVRRLCRESLAAYKQPSAITIEPA